jgi:uncharacterized protein YceH (UPF0502 family)
VDLTEEEVRVLGALIEKEVTTPEYYPLSLNALTNACNQSSNREPVVEYDETTVLAAVESLRKRNLVHQIKRSDSRVIKYRHVLTEDLNLDPRELAVMCVLMLRGPQTVGELRTRGTRLFDFASIEDVETPLNSLMARLPLPPVVRLERRPGQKEVRYAHALGGPPKVDVGPAALSSVEVDEDRLQRLEADVESLRAEVATLRVEIQEFRKQFE